MTAYRRSDRPGTWTLAAMISAGFVVLIWALEIVDTASGHALDDLGVEPRTDEGLVGIVTAPLLHFGFDHLGANTLPALVMLFLVLVTGIQRGLLATAVIWLVGGVGVWLVGPANTEHAGASVLIFGWLVHLIVRGVWTRSAGEIALGVVVLLGYGSVLLGVLPGQPGISWQGHLFGALGGLLAAPLLGRDRRPRSVV
jgi:membrane associated rhomboid family serine protease